MRRSSTDYEREAQDFWAGGSAKQQDFAHYRGVGRWRDDENWLSVGRGHLKYFRDLRSKFPSSMEARRMLEWGPGGGSNVLAFAEEFPHITAVDISAQTLEECARQVAENCAGLDFQTRLITTEDPEAVCGSGPFDFFLTTAVIQHMPTKEWVGRMFSIVQGEMRPGGQALIQFRTGSQVDRSRVYKKACARWCTFKAEEMEELCCATGWHVLSRYGNPDGESGYVYLFLGRP